MGVGLVDVGWFGLDWVWVGLGCWFGLLGWFGWFGFGFGWGRKEWPQGGKVEKSTKNLEEQEEVLTDLK